MVTIVAAAINDQPASYPSSSASINAMISPSNARTVSMRARILAANNQRFLHVILESNVLQQHLVIAIETARCLCSNVSVLDVEVDQRNAFERIGIETVNHQVRQDVLGTAQSLQRNGPLRKLRAKAIAADQRELSGT